MTVAHDAAAMPGDDRRRRLACSRIASAVARLVLAYETRVADNVDGEDRGEPAGRRLLFGDSGPAHAFEKGLKLGQIRRVVAHRRPIGAGARDGEGRVERETGLDCGMRLVKSTKLREGGGRQKIRSRIISVGLDRPSKPRDRLLITAEDELRDAHVSLPGIALAYRAD